MHGDIVDDAGQPIIEELELWQRDPVECIKELISNPAFRDVMQYAPEKVYHDCEGKVRIFGETWSADWWWQLQVKLISFSILDV